MLTIRHLILACLSLIIPVATSGEDREENSPKETVVYNNDFEKAAGDQWSRADLSVTPNGKRKFLGEFGPGNVRLNLTDLPEHRFVRVSFDLFLIKSWDGSSRWGPDLWELSVAGHQRLIYATFTTCGFFSDNNRQTFPDDHPTPSLHPAWTGASEKQTLGYRFFLDRNKGKGYVTDAVYRMDVLFPHSKSNLELDFVSHCEDAKTDQSWGIDNVRVATRTKAAKLTNEALKQHWNLLASDDSHAAFGSLWQLAASGEQAVQFIQQQTQQHVFFNEQARAFIKQLEDNDFNIREKATDGLIELGPEIARLIKAEFDTAKSAEAKNRLKRVLGAFEQAEQVDQKQEQRLRARRVLKVIDTKAAKALHAMLLQRDQPDAN